MCAMLAYDFDRFRQQESIFVTFNLLVLGTLILTHTLFGSVWGGPPPVLLIVLTGAFAVQIGELAWLKARRQALRPPAITVLTLFSILVNLALALLLGWLSNRQDIQYFIVLVVPVLEAAFRLSLLSTLIVIGVADFVTFFWVWEYQRRHLVSVPGEYLESGTVSLIFGVVGIVVWLLVNHLEQRERSLSESLHQLDRAKERLLSEEKLAAIGRLSSAIAHEIRNPVAIIASALSTANRADTKPTERDEMFDIAAKEAARLEKLTTDFLTYARPLAPRKAHTPVANVLAYVAEVCRPLLTAKGVVLSVENSHPLTAAVDADQVQQALINLVMNAVEASPPAGKVRLWADTDGGRWVRIDVEQAAGPIPPEATAQMFEPFFTTKRGGTGLGLAIARNIARAHGGDLVLSTNRPGCVSFTFTVAATAASAAD